ncbi:hypothetical protein HanPI659440_Chr03g0125341 [Helianthus annuus]|nr:hypothetical protein HanPI659440_Chr03g0125341 [Helianthus annuus]
MNNRRDAIMMHVRQSMGHIFDDAHSLDPVHLNSQFTVTQGAKQAPLFQVFIYKEVAFVM